jgi:hypothetical protein
MELLAEALDPLWSAARRLDVAGVRALAPQANHEELTRHLILVVRKAAAGLQLHRYLICRLLIEAGANPLACIDGPSAFTQAEPRLRLFMARFMAAEEEACE